MGRIFLLFTFACVFWVTSAYAGDLFTVEPMPVRSGIVQCGVDRELIKSCEKDTRCCPLKDMYVLQQEELAQDTEITEPAADNVRVALAQ